MFLKTLLISSNLLRSSRRDPTASRGGTMKTAESECVCVGGGGGRGWVCV